MKKRRSNEGMFDKDLSDEKDRYGKRRKKVAHTLKRMKMSEDQLNKIRNIRNDYNRRGTRAARE